MRSTRGTKSTTSFDVQIETLLDKLFDAANPFAEHEYINLFEVLVKYGVEDDASASTLDDTRIRYKSPGLRGVSRMRGACRGAHVLHRPPLRDTLSLFEKQLLKAALPYCLQKAKIRENCLSPVGPPVDASRTIEGSSHQCVKKENSKCLEFQSNAKPYAPVCIPSALSPTAPITATCLNRASLSKPGRDPIVRGGSPCILWGVGKDDDITTPPSLAVTKRFLREVLLTLPRWALWNSWDNAQKKIAHAAFQDEALKPVSRMKSRRKNRILHSGQRSREEDEEDEPLDPECTFTPQLRPYLPRYMMSRRGLPKSDPLVLLRTYCKHFSAGQWIQDYDNLVDDFRNCTFQPNAERFYQPKLREVLLTPPKDPFNAGDPFASIKEQFDEKQDENPSEKSVRTTEHLDARHVDAATIEKARIAILSPGDGIFSGSRAAQSKTQKRHRACLHPRHLPVELTPSGRAMQHRSQSCVIRPKEWQEGLRAGYKPFFLPTQTAPCSRPERRHRIDRKKRDDYDRYIRLSARGLVAVTVPDALSLEGLVEDAAREWYEAENPPPVLVQKSGGGRAQGATFAIYATPQEHRVNAKRNYFSVLRHGIEAGEISAPLRVVGVQLDPLDQLERRLNATKPLVPFEELIKRWSSCE